MKILKILFAVVLMAWPIFSEAQMQKNLKGMILLQVQQNGEAWYVNPADEKRYYMGRPADAFELMRSLGVGISNADIRRIPVADKNLLSGPDSDGDGLSDMIEDSFGTDKYKADTDGDGYDDKTEILSGFDPLGPGRLPIDEQFSHRQKGKILLQVEQNGEAWYVYPKDGKRYFLGRPGDAFEVMRSLGLGITDSDLALIGIAEGLIDEQKIEYSVEAYLNKSVYYQQEEILLVFELTANQNINNVDLEALGIASRYGHHHFNQTEKTFVEKDKTKIVEMRSELPECGPCSGINPGLHYIDVKVGSQGIVAHNQRIQFEIKE